MNSMLGHGAYEPRPLELGWERRTLRQNIDARLAKLAEEAAGLERMRDTLERGGSLLDVRVEDLQRALQPY